SPRIPGGRVAPIAALDGDVLERSVGNEGHDPGGLDHLEEVGEQRPLLERLDRPAAPESGDPASPPSAPSASFRTRTAGSLRTIFPRRMKHHRRDLVCEIELKKKALPAHDRISITGLSRRRSRRCAP